MAILATTLPSALPGLPCSLAALETTRACLASTANGVDHADNKAIAIAAVGLSLLLSSFVVAALARILRLWSKGVWLDEPGRPTLLQACQLPHSTDFFLSTLYLCGGTRTRTLSMQYVSHSTDAETVLGSLPNVTRKERAEHFPKFQRHGSLWYQRATTHSQGLFAVFQSRLFA